MALEAPESVISKLSLPVVVALKIVAIRGMLVKVVMYWKTVHVSLTYYTGFTGAPNIFLSCTHCIRDNSFARPLLVLKVSHVYTKDYL